MEYEEYGILSQSCDINVDMSSSRHLRVEL